MMTCADVADLSTWTIVYEDEDLEKVLEEGFDLAILPAAIGGGFVLEDDPHCCRPLAAGSRAKKLSEFFAEQ